MKTIIAIAAALTLSGCAAGDKLELPKWDFAPVSFEQDNTCATMRKVSWSVNDTPETIQSARKHNARFDRLCGKSKPVA
jgi:hypothetical protein